MGQSSEDDEFKGLIEGAKCIAKRAVANFHAGNLSNHVQAWRRLTSDWEILKIIQQGVALEFHSFPVQSQSPKPYRFDRIKIERIQVKI